MKVSADGSLFRDAPVVAGVAGAASLPQGALLPDGTAGALALAFAADADTGVTRPGADQIGLATGGVQRRLLSTTAPTATLPVLAPAGTAGVPSLAFSGDPDTGLFSAAADAIGLAFGGTERARWTATGSTPARLSMRTVGAGSTTLNERMRVDANGAQVFGRLTMNSAAAYAMSVAIADDAVATITPGRTGGFLMMTCGGGVGSTVTFEAHPALILFGIGTSAASIVKNSGFAGVGGSVDVVTGTTLTGTTGNVTVSARPDGTLLVENRRGGSLGFSLWVM